MKGYFTKRGLRDINAMKSLCLMAFSLLLANIGFAQQTELKNISKTL